jgi:hypothetical protein
MFSWGEAGVERLGEFRWVAFWFGRYGQSRWIMLGSVGVNYVLVRQAWCVQVSCVLLG